MFKLYEDEEFIAPPPRPNNWLKDEKTETALPHCIIASKN